MSIDTLAYCMGGINWEQFFRLDQERLIQTQKERFEFMGYNNSKKNKYKLGYNQK